MEQVSVKDLLAVRAVEALDLYLFETLDQVREQAHPFLQDYNERRPHDALDGLPPGLFRNNC